MTKETADYVRTIYKYGAIIRSVVDTLVPYNMATEKSDDPTSGYQAIATDKEIWKLKVAQYVKKTRALCKNMKV